MNLKKSKKTIAEREKKVDSQKRQNKDNNIHSVEALLPLVA